MIGIWPVSVQVHAVPTNDPPCLCRIGLKYDQNGSATGQMASLTQSWPGYSYQLGSVDRVFAPMIAVALSWWPFSGGNNSHDYSSLSPLQYPPLASCTQTRNGTSMPCPTSSDQTLPGDAMYNAKQDLVRQLMTKTQCQQAAHDYVYSKSSLEVPRLQVSDRRLSVFGLSSGCVFLLRWH